MQPNDYDPFLTGPFAVATRTVEAQDTSRDRRFPCELWIPQDPGPCPLIVYSHASGYHRRASAFLCTHLSSHGYLVAAIDHSEVVAPEFSRRENETDDQRAARVAAIIQGRVPDIRFLLDFLLEQPPVPEVQPDPTRIGIVGHSFGGWTALAVPDADTRIRSIVALAPGGASNPRPGILPLKLAFEWKRDIPILFLVADNDVALPISGMYELFERAPAPKRMFVLRRADHAHFLDNVEQEHERVRNLPFPPVLAWLPSEMRPIGELCPAEHAHLFTRALTLSHFDATLRDIHAAETFLAGDVETELARRGIDAAKV